MTDRSDRMPPPSRSEIVIIGGGAEVAGDRYPATRHFAPRYDPAGSRLRS